MCGLGKQLNRQLFSKNTVVSLRKLFVTDLGGHILSFPLRLDCDSDPYTIENCTKSKQTSKLQSVICFIQ